MNILEILGNIGFDWQVALLNFINFLIVFWLLKRFVFGPIQNILESRKQTIDDGLENAKKAESELMMAKESADKTTNEAKVAANKIVAEAKEEESSIVEEAKVKAQEESAGIISQADETIKKDRARMEAELRNKTADLVIDGVEKILKEEMDKSKSEQLIAKLISSKND